jgi:hypothetical protein
MILDLCLYFNEKELLDIRLATLYDHVDRFVIVEATSTHAGNAKPAHFEMPEQYADKIEYHLIDIYGETPIARENFHRNMLGMLAHPNPDDYVMLSDIDEIPNPRKIGWIGPFSQSYHCYFINRWSPDVYWPGTYGCIGETLRMITAEHVRERRTIDTACPDGGWHFSFMGDINTKLEAFHHQEFNNLESKQLFADYKNNMRSVHNTELVEYPTDKLPERALQYSQFFA